MQRFLLMGTLFLAASGCRDASVPKAETPVPTVTVAPPAQETIRRYEYFTGRAEARDEVEIRAQVSGTLVKIHFTPGSDVKAKDPLFDIDEEPFKIALSQAEAQEQAATARVKTLTAEVARLERGRRTNAVTVEEYEKAVGMNAEAVAAVQSAKASVAQATLDLGYTKIVAPMDGVIGDKLVSVGNLISGTPGNPTLLATIVRVEPLDVAFDVDENTLQRLQAAIREGRIKITDNEAIPVEAALAIHGDQYPLNGTINFRNNKVDPGTGTIRVKAEIPNPRTEGVPRLLTPGNFLRVRVPVGDPVAAMLVPESALLSDLGIKYLYAVDAENKVVRLEAALGPPNGSSRVIDSVRGEGDPAPRPLRADERIVVGGLLRVRPGMLVDPKVRPAAKP